MLTTSRVWLSSMLVAFVFLVAAGLTRAQDPPKPKGEAMPKELPLEDAIKKARVDGKYEMLLRQFKVEKDAEKHKDFTDFGYRGATEYAGHKDLPKGFWVYVYPYWYIWRDETAVAKNKRSWGPEQATGEPDTPNAGDFTTAWASQTADGQDEWLMVEYAEPVVPTAVLIHENLAPGAVYKVTVFKLDGAEVEAWKGKDPTGTDEQKGISLIPMKVDFKINRVKIYVASRDVANWNEIDAVGLRDTEKKVQWATAADASTTYASGAFAAPAPVPAMPDRFEQRFSRLERELQELKAQNAELKEMLKELKELLKKDK